MEKLYDTKEAGAICHFSSYSLLPKIKNGSLKAMKVGKKWLIKERDLQEFMDSYSKKSIAEQEPAI